MEEQLVLVVDDDPDHRALIETVVAEFVGARCALARDGEAALELARQIGPDLVLLDLVLPMLDGFETVKRLKADPETQVIPVIALTALPEKKCQEALGVGCVEYIPKPFDVGELADRVRHYLMA